jgi:hypothetical protein
MSTTAQIYPDWTNQLKPVLDAIQIDSETSFIFRGEHINTETQPPAHLEHPCFNADPMTYLLHKYIYEHFHMGEEELHDTAHNALDQQFEISDSDEEDFQDRLSQAHAGQSQWSRNWKALAVRNGEVCAEKDGRIKIWQPGQYLFEGAPSSVKKDDMIEVLLKRDSLSLQKGFYYVFGNFAADEWCEHSSVRLYLNLSAQGAAHVVRLLTHTFYARKFPFLFKCLNIPSDYTRRDSAVLYLGKRYAHMALSLLSEIYPQLLPHLRDGNPMLTKTLAPGVALAEDPDSSDSFGTHRTRAIAEGILTAFFQNQHTESERMHWMMHSFEDNNISTEKPYLSAKPFDPFGLDLLELRH